MIEVNTETANFAAVDLGSNAIRFMVKTATHQPNGQISSSVLMNMRVPIRLGEDVFLKGKISSKKVQQLVQMMKSVRHLLKVCNVQSFRACGTSALREAENAKKVQKAVEKGCGLKIEVISGREEARMLFANRQIENRKALHMYVDVGGGSTEISLIKDGMVIESKSFRIGTVRMLLNATDKNVLEDIRAEVSELNKRYQDVVLIGSGGNIEKYYSLSDQKDKNKKTFPVASLRKLYDTLSPLSIEERMEQFNLKRDRADVIVPAGEIFLNIAECMETKDIKVPMYGLSDGIIADQIRQYWYEKK